MRNVRYLKKFVPLVFCSLSLAAILGCPSQSRSRLSHYRQGGAYFGGAPSPSADGQFIVYSSPRTGNGDLYRVKIDGTDTERLTSDPRYECDAEYSPDGTKIVFVREQDYQGRICLMNADGTGAVQLTKGHGDEGDPNFSPDGSQIVFSRVIPELELKVGISRARELFLINISTGAETRLTNNELEDVFPALSPDGERVCFTRKEQTWIMKLDGTELEVVGLGSQPRFSPDGEQIVLVAGQYGRQIDVMNIDGSDHSILYGKNTRLSHPVFFPNGLSVLFLEEPGGDGVGNVMIGNSDGSSFRAIANTR